MVDRDGQHDLPPVVGGVGLLGVGAVALAVGLTFDGFIGGLLQGSGFAVVVLGALLAWKALRPTPRRSWWLPSREQPTWRPSDDRAASKGVEVGDRDGGRS